MALMRPVLEPCLVVDGQLPIHASGDDEGSRLQVWKDDVPPDLTGALRKRGPVASGDSKNRGAAVLDKFTSCLAGHRRRPGGATP